MFDRMDDAPRPGSQGGSGPSDGRSAADRCPAALRMAFEARGWTPRATVAGAFCRADYVFAASCRVASCAKPRSAIVFGYVSPREVRLTDLWSLVAALTTERADLGVICLGPETTISAQAREVAAVLRLEILRVAA